MVNTAARGCAPAGPADPGRSHAWSGRPQPRGIMTTSPKALSPLADRVKEMLPLRPVAALEYDPSHWPVSAATSRPVPARGTGGWRAAPQAVTKAPSAAYRVLVRGLIGRSRCSVVEEDTSSECCLMRKTSGRPSWLHSDRSTRHEDLADSHGSNVTVRCRRETEPRRWEIPRAEQTGLQVQTTPGRRWCRRASE